MADSIVSLAIDKISSLLINEANFLSNVKEDVERLQFELKRMQSFLKVADRSQDQDERVRIWVDQIRDVAYDAEDVIDEFLLKIPRKEVTFCGCNCIRMLTKAPQLHGIGTQVNSIRTKIGDIYSSMQMAGIKFAGEAEGSTSTREMQQRLRRTDPDETDEHVIKLESATQEVLSQLMQQDDRLRVVSIVGMGGLGKTTLAKQIYNSVRVKEHFDCLSWAFLSQHFSPTDILLRIKNDVGETEKRNEDEKLIKALKEELYAKRNKGDWVRMENEDLITALKDVVKEALKEKRYLQRMDEDELISALKDELKATREEKLTKAVNNALKEKRYLVVLDDIWKDEAWDSLKRAFPNGKKGSKVLFTTRIKEVALYADPWSSPVTPSFLNEEEGWELLSKKAFPQDIVGKRGYSPEFEEIGKEMVRKVEGLPLAIAVLGGLLGNKSIKEWKRIQKDVNAQFQKLQERNPYAGVEWVLALSYNDLPFQLRQCFLYLSQFPEDSEFHKKRLIRKWIAEGFIAQQLEGNGNETMEDVGEDYLEELVNRCMVQVSERDYTGIGIKKCHMHDLMREMCISKAREEKFLQVVTGGQAQAINSRRIVAYYDFPSVGVGARIRSLLIANSRSPYLSQIYQLVSFFKLLRVLVLEKSILWDNGIPPEIGRLIHVRYLELSSIQFPNTRDTRITLPTSIGNMKSLYTLNMQGTIVRIPDVLWKLECLGHLIVDEDADGKFRLETLKQLKTLKRIKAKNLIRNDAMLKLSNLRDLQIIFEQREEIEKILRSIFNLRQLRSLKMISGTASFPTPEPLSTCHHLAKLSLHGVLAIEENGQNLRFLPASLAKLELKNSKLKEDPMVVLEQMPNLRILSLGRGSYEGVEMACSTLGFPKLEVLEFQSQPNLEEWRVEEGAMPCLKTLILRGLYRLKRIPDGLKHVHTLIDLKLVAMPREFERRVQVIDGVEGEDFHKVRHIPSVTVGLPPYF